MKKIQDSGWIGPFQTAHSAEAAEVKEPSMTCHRWLLWTHTLDGSSPHPPANDVAVYKLSSYTVADSKVGFKSVQRAQGQVRKSHFL